MTNAITVPTIDAFMEVLAAKVAQLEALREARARRFEADFADLNGGLEPTKDASGRYHAPCDGYICENRHGDERTFLAGEYLPFVGFIDEDELFGRASLVKARTVRYARIPYAAADDARRIVEFLVDNLSSKLPEWEVKAYCGQVFDGDAGPTCHLYVDASSSRLVDAIASFVTAKHLHARAEAAKASNCPEVPEGRTNVVGEVVSIKNTDYGVKMLVVTDAGYKIYGSLPGTLYGIERGARVSFSATLKRSHNDAYFGFYSRPTKAMVI